MKHIAFVGGASGGHITPVASVIEYGLQDTDIAGQCKPFRFGERDGLEKKTVDRLPAVTFVPILAGKFRRYRTPGAILSNIFDLFKGIRGFFQSLRGLKKYKIDIVFSKGSHVAVPVCFAARLLRIPVVMHESDTYAGLANRLVATISRDIFVGFPGVFRREIVIGQLLSPKVFQINPVFEKTLPHSSRTIVLVMGGSQGAGMIFETLLKLLQTQDCSAFHFLILLGVKNSHYAHDFLSHTQVTTFPFIQDPTDMAAVYSVSDISITRGSATSLAEQHAFGLQKIIIPTPFTGGNHQRYNGLRYQDTFGDTLFEQNSELPERLWDALQGYTGYKKPTTRVDEKTTFGPLRAVWEVLLS